MNPALKPCVFCNSDWVFLGRQIIGNAKRVTISCLSCYMVVYHDDSQDYFNDVTNIVRIKWNKRYQRLRPCRHGNSPVGIYDGIWFWKKFYMACWRCDCEGPKCKTPIDSIEAWNKENANN